MDNKEKIKRCNIDKNNFDNVGRILVAEKDVLKSFIKNRKPVLNREGKDTMAVELSVLGNSLLTVIKHFDQRITELDKVIKRTEEEIKGE